MDLAKGIAFFLTVLFIIAFLGTGYYVLQYLGIINLKAKPVKEPHQPSPSGGPGFSTELATTTITPKKFGLLSDNFKLILGITVTVITSRILIMLMGSLAVILLTNRVENIFSIFEYRWYKADSPLYINIAQNWYVNHGDDRFLIVFYPLYPILIRIVNYLIHNYLLSGIIVSNLSLIVACVYLYKLVEIDFNKQVALNAVKFLLIFPFSFFLGLIFSDSLFIALTVMVFYYMRQRKWFLTGLLGGLASLTRNFGILLLVPVVIEYLAQTQFIQKLKQRNWKLILSDFLRHGLYQLLIPFGFFLYLLINKLITGNWFTFLKYQREHWCNAMNVNIYDNLKTLLSCAFTWKPVDTACMFIPPIVLAFFIVLLVFYALRKVRISYLAYILLYLFICFSATWLISGGRYMAGVFPVYLITALMARNRFSDLILTLISSIGLCCYTIAFVIGTPLY